MKRVIAGCMGTVIWAIASPAAAERARCDIPREARDIWRCENGFVIGPENVIIRLPIPETDPEALYRAGLEAAKREDWRIAIAYFTAAHQRAHLVPRYMYNLGLAHARAGHEVAAIGWFAAYLVAESDAPNRAAVWTQIAELEARSRRKTDVIWAGAIRAVTELPTNSYSVLPGWSVPRHRGYKALAIEAAKVLDWDRARQFIHQGEATIVYASFERPQPIEVQLEGLRSAAREAAVRIYDFETAEAQDDPQVVKARAAAGFGNARIRPRLEYNWQSNMSRGSVLHEADVANRPSFLRIGVGDSERSYDLARQGRDKEALIKVRSEPGGWVDYGMKATRVGEISLLIGNAAGSERALAMARKLLPRSSAYFGDVARLEALLLAERGDLSQAKAILQATASRRNVGSVYSEDDNRCCIGLGSTRSAQYQWSEFRNYPVAQLVQFLFWRGRTVEAIALSEEVDSARRISLFHRGVGATQSEEQRGLIYAARERAYAHAAGGMVVDPERRLLIEDAVVTARRLPGAAYDLENWVMQTARGSDAQQQVRDIVAPATDLALGMRMIRISYQRTGKTWGQ